MYFLIFMPSFATCALFLRIDNKRFRNNNKIITRKMDTLTYKVRAK